MVEDYIVQDPDFYMPKDKDKLNFEQLIFYQLNVIRLAGSKDMGNLLLFDLSGKPSDEILQGWFKNMSEYVNSVEQLKAILDAYSDELFRVGVVKIEATYVFNFRRIKQKALLKLKRMTKPNRNDRDKLKHEVIIKERNFTLKHTPTKCKEIYIECIKLAQRTGFIASNDTIEDST